MDENETADDVRASALSERDRAVLDFEQRAPTAPGAREAAIRRDLGLGAVRYQQLLNSLIDRPAALAYAPMLVGRLQRLRAARRDARATRSFGPTH
ncbi:DUF3263 domain-containing protein [Frigoribacterium sp. Leaf186]|uniref:DUF3263 domain-containing protein n=1 Tax=Frigoribacterium sp. Leaf186 TaxID=1736293 RepID=UPI0007004D59|nr:DUF3263 domain-containing protein [Frigoribacterium sp. Leaf186]KQS17057.1 hypothetical protein ASG05_05790 [Frigoribacterium sp. Leaf186]